MTSARVAWPRTAGPLELRTPTSDGIDEVLVWRNRPEVIRWLLRTTVDPGTHASFTHGEYMGVR